MNKSILYLLAMTMLIVSCAPKNDNSRLARFVQKEADMANQTLAGKQLDQYTVMDSVVFDGNNFIYNYTVKEDSTFTMDSFDGIQDGLATHMEESWRTDKPMIALAERIRKLGGKIVYKYTGNTSGTTKIITIEP